MQFHDGIGERVELLREFRIVDVNIQGKLDAVQRYGVHLKIADIGCDGKVGPLAGQHDVAQLLVGPGICNGGAVGLDVLTELRVQHRPICRA
jgi:hypothetical protein